MNCPICGHTIPHPVTTRIQSIRQERRAKGQCASCGRISGRRYRCVQCRIVERAKAKNRRTA